MSVRRILHLLILTPLVLPAALAAPQPPQTQKRPELAPFYGYRVTDVDGKLHRMGIVDKVVPMVVAFVDAACPISNRTVPDLNQLAKLAEQKGFAFYGVISDPTLTHEQARAYRDRFELRFPLILDTLGDIGLRLQPRAVPEVFLIDSTGGVVYRGKVDNRFAAVGKKRTLVTEFYLRDAIEALAAGRRPASADTTPVGCLFASWKQAPSHVTYLRHIEPLMRANCVECHREGGIAPFSLDSFDQAKRSAEMAAYVAGAGIMPPWRPHADIGKFRDRRVLSARQIEVLKKWVTQETPLGEAADRLPQPESEDSGWRLGEPDLELQMREPYELPAQGQDIYRYFVLPSGMLQKRDLVAIDFAPGDPTVVHHANFFMDYYGKARQEDEKDEEPGFSVFGGGSFMEYDGAAAIGGWAPGADPYRLPEGLGIELYPGGDLVIEIHYHLSGRRTSDQSTIALYFADQPVDRYISGLVIGTQELQIPAGEGQYCRQIHMEVTRSMTLIDIMPHMHYLGKRAQLNATLPDGTVIPLIYVDEWDLNWQNIYVYLQPIHLPAGTRLDGWFTFDNSEQNPANPSRPPKPVAWGWASDDEMAEFYLTIIPDDPKDLGSLLETSRASWLRAAGCTEPPPDAASMIQAAQPVIR
ncbi:Redoxin family protein [Sulfidibacter corallicola]|uniref:Redoxin family protein n=1 Tax=Sulfidibacter corallicola TaxID=2818388 RepID=A0A8A4TLM1_SULCO|nr:redoxin family protein [Sulfidibacter corallicola]QTD50463.1 redoxin family protein [Sulfidibacter corallicola]